MYKGRVFEYQGITYVVMSEPYSSKMLVNCKNVKKVFSPSVRVTLNKEDIENSKDFQKVNSPLGFLSTYDVIISSLMYGGRCLGYRVSFNTKYLNYQTRTWELLPVFAVDTPSTIEYKEFRKFLASLGVFVRTTNSQELLPPKGDSLVTNNEYSYLYGVSYCEGSKNLQVTLTNMCEVLIKQYNKISTLPIRALEVLVSVDSFTPPFDSGGGVYAHLEGLPKLCIDTPMVAVNYSSYKRLGLSVDRVYRVLTENCERFKELYGIIAILQRSRDLDFVFNFY